MLLRGTRFQRAPWQGVMCKKKMTIAIVCLVIAIVVVISFKALSFFRGGTGFLPPSNEVKEIYIAYSIGNDESADEIDNSKEFRLTSVEKIEPILKLLEGKEFPRFPLLNSESMDFDESWFINIFPIKGEPFYIYVDKYNVSEYEMKNSSLYEHLRKNYT